MAMDKSVGGVTVIYKCPKCGVHFEAYSKAFRHLKVKHDFKVRSGLESVTFQRCNIRIERLKERNRNDEHNLDHSLLSSSYKAEGTTNKDVAVADTPKRNKGTNSGCRTRWRARDNAAIKKKEGGRVEIKLDDLKASDIEALMEDLFQTTNGTGGSVRTSRRANNPNNGVIDVKDTATDTNTASDTDASSTSSYSSLFVETIIRRKKIRRRNIKTPPPPSGLDCQVETGQEISEDLNGEEYGDEIERRTGNDNNDGGDVTVRKQNNAISKPRLLHQCKFCADIFVSSITLGEHMRSNHLQNGVYTCPTEGCGKTYTLVKSLYQHLRLEGLSKLPCPHCDRKFKTQEKMEKHIKVHQKVTTSVGRLKNPYAYPCPLCEKRYTRSDNLKAHFIIHLENNPFVCEMSGCGRKFGSEKYLKQHVQLHIEENDAGDFTKDREDGRVKLKMEDNDEDEEFLRIEVGSQHFDDTMDYDGATPTRTSQNSESAAGTESDTSKFSDNEEEEGDRDHELNSLPFATLTSLIVNDPVYHKLVAENPRVAALIFGSKINCALCNREVKDYTLQTHMKKVHSQDNTPGAGARGTNSMPSSVNAIAITKKSASSSSSTVVILCGKCGYPSTSSDDLAEHMNKEHPGKVDHRCKYCGHYMKDLKSLERHELRVHLTEKKYSCPHCSSKFVSSGTLRNHILLKHEKPSESEEAFCHICKKKFGSKDSLKSHNRRCHRRVKCKFCGQSSANKFILQRHIQIVHLGVKATDIGRRTEDPSSSQKIPVEGQVKLGDDEANNQEQILGL